MKNVIYCALAILLSGCGGGGDDAAAPSTPPVPSIASGFYLGVNINRHTIDQMLGTASYLVLEGNEIWYADGLDRPDEAAVGKLAFAQVATASNGVQLNVFRGVEVLAVLAGGAPATIAVDVYEGRGVLSAFRPPITFGPTGTRLPNDRYQYDRPVAVAEYSGSWQQSRCDVRLNCRSTQFQPISISPAGAVTGIDSGGCNLVGSVAQHPSGKNVATVALAISGCALAGQYSGIGVRYLDRADYGLAPPVRPALVLQTIRADRTAMYHLKLYQ